MGVYLDHDGWDLYSEYTWLRSYSHDKVGARASYNSSFPLIFNAITKTDGTMSGASSRWALHYNVFDLSLRRNFYVSNRLTLRPHLGLKGTWQRQEWNYKIGIAPISFVDGNQQPKTFTGPAVATFLSKLWGIGVCTGLDLGWYFTKNWSLYGGAGFTGMWTDYYDVSMDARYNNGGNKIRPLFITNSLLMLRFVAEFSLGFKWEEWFADDAYHVSIQAGWDEIIWLDQGYNFRFAGTQVVFGDLTLHGLDIKLRIGF